MLYPGGVVMPDDLSKLSRVCAKICAEHKVKPKSGNAQALAAHVFRLFMNGLTEEDELLGTMRNKHKHKLGHR
jgi:hypothetical protein